MNDLLNMLARLKAAKISFSLTQVREEAIMVQAAVPGERWEIEAFADGQIEVEVFRSDGKILEGVDIKDMIRKFSD